MRTLIAGSVAAVALVVSDGRLALAQASSSVHVVTSETTVLSRPMPKSDVVRVVPPDTALEVIGREREWDWVVLPPDANGTRHSGWVRTRGVETSKGATPDRTSADAAFNDKKLKREQERKLKQEQAQLKQEQAVKLKQEQVDKQVREQEERRVEKAQRELKKARREYAEVAGRTGAVPTSEKSEESSPPK